MKRKLMDKLIAWKNQDDRKPLILLGARQTGKTWLMEEFAKNEFDNYVKVDFMYEENMRSLFDQDLNPERIIKEIELRTNTRINPEHTLLIFDEVQEAPKCITSLKYFCEKARSYHVIAAGSYMGIAVRKKDVSFPVGKVNQLTLHPMCFSEFARAVKGDVLADVLDAADMESLASVSDVLTKCLKEYFVVGGMPEVVNSFKENSDFNYARTLQLHILDDYDADFSKHAPARILERMRLVWKSLPSQLARENKKFIYGALRSGARSRDFEESLQWLADYGVINKVSRVSALRMPLISYEDISAFKLFSLDVGLLGALASLDPASVLDGSRLFTEFKGAMTEQYVAQELCSKGHSLVYWSSDKGQAEVDFATSINGDILPIEVKAGENLQSKSLKVACNKFNLDRCVRTSLSQYRDEGQLVNIPLWAISSLDKLV